MSARNRQQTVLINGEQYYSAQKAQEELGMTYSGLRYQVISGNVKSEIPRGRKQAYYRGIDVDQLARELQAYALYRKRDTELLRVTTKEEMTECLEIGQAAFGIERVATDERMKLLQKNPDLYYLLRDEDQTIGYFSILPLKPGKLDNALKLTLPKRIDSEDIADFNEDKSIDLLLSAIAVKPGFTIEEKHSYGARLIAGLVGVIIKWGKNGITINTVAAKSNMPDGIRLMKHAGFTEIESPTPERRTFIINVKESGVPFIRQYKQALQESREKDKTRQKSKA
jgi:hypothetical protein